MTRILRSLGLAIAAIAAIAPAAQAQIGQLTADSYPAILTGNSVAGFIFDVGTEPVFQIGCNTEDFEGTLGGPANVATLKPKFQNNCVAGLAGGSVPTTVVTNGCDFTFGFEKPGTTGQPAGTGVLKAGIDCPPGKEIEIHIYENGVKHGENAAMCTYKIAPGPPRVAGFYHNMAGPPKDVLMTVSAAFTSRVATEGGLIFCGGDPLMQHATARITGDYTLRAYQDTGGIEGAQMNLDVG